MKKLLGLALLLIPSLCSADRLGSLRSAADVLLTTQAVSSAGLIHSTDTLQAGSTFYVSSGTVAGQLSVTGNGNGNIQLTISGSTYTVTSSSSGSYSVGQAAVFSSTSGTLIGGTSGVAVGGTGTQIQYRVDATTLGGISNSIVTSTAIIVSTLSVLNNTTTSANVNPGLLDVYSQSPHPVNLATFGSSTQGNLLIVPSNGLIDMSKLGSKSGSLGVGDKVSGSGLWANRIYSIGDTSAFLDLRTLGTSTGTWQTTSGSGPGDIRLQPAGNLMLTVSNQTGITASSGVLIQANGDNFPYLLYLSTASSASGAPYILKITTSSVLNMGPGSSFAYRQTTPSFPLDWACNASDGVDCMNVSHSNGTAINAIGTSNNPAFQAANNTAGASASALKASKTGVAGQAADFETDIATAVFANSTTGTAIRANSSAGTAIQVDAGNVVLNALATSNNVCTDGSHNLTTTGCNSGVTLSSGVYYASSVITATSTITSSMTVVITSCTTRGASPNAWITMYLGSANNSSTPETHMFYDVGADSCSIKIQAAPGELIESTGTLVLNAQSQHASIQALGNGLWGAGNGGIQYTPWSVFTTQDDVGSFTVAVATQVTSCPIYIPVPTGFMGFRINRVVGNGLIGGSIVDAATGRYITGVSSMNVSVGGAVNYFSGGVTQLAPGNYRALFTIPNTVTSISGSNSVNSNKMFCGTVGTSAFGADLSGFTPTLPGTTNSGTYPAIDLLFNGGLSSF